MLPITGNTYNYHEFITYVEKLVEEKKTSGHKQSEALVHYTFLNYKRMSRWNKKLDVSPFKDILDKFTPQKWIVITESWCGDSAQNLPFIGKLSELSSKISLEIISRDDNPNWMDEYHTNGSKSIPKLIGFDTQTHQELFTWGPRPVPAQELLLNWKEKNDKTWEEFETDLHTWYAKDKAKTITDEFHQLFAKALH